MLGDVLLRIIHLIIAFKQKLNLFVIIEINLLINYIIGKYTIYS